MTEPAIPNGDFQVPEISTRAILLGSGPRFARDAFGPMLLFYAGWKLSGLVAGIVLSTIASLVAYRWEQAHDRPGLMARLALVFIVVQAAIGLAAQSEVVYLAQPVLLNALAGLAFVVSVFVRRPLAALFAGEMYPFPDEVRQSDTFRRTFGVITLAWGAYMLARSAVRMAMLTSGSVDAFIGVNMITGMPLTVLLMSWSVWYAVRAFRRSAEFGEAIRLLEASA
jgi:intracellular septation protein A